MSRIFIGRVSSEELMAHRRAQYRERNRRKKPPALPSGRLKRFEKAWRDGLELHFMAERFGISESDVTKLARQLGLIPTKTNGRVPVPARRRTRCAAV